MMTEADPFNLRRFIDVQAAIIERVRDELRAGRKSSHWMWFVFPQVAGLGFSAMSQKYAIASLAEARAYLAHPVLGARLRECVALLMAIDGKSANAIFRAPDDMKLQSCLTLFAETTDEDIFARALDKYFEGRRDRATMALLRSS